MQVSRLTLLCKLFGWQGGTIYQAAEELKRVVKIYPMINASYLLSCPDHCFEHVCKVYKENA